MAMDDAQVFVESSWNVLQGSLDKCVTVVFLDPETQDPIISTSPVGASEKLVLIPPAEPVPCEITVRFQGRLCHVQSFYTLSTARICELYSQSPKTDREYICTVKGWIPYEDSCSSEAGAEVVLEAADATHRNVMQETGFIEDSIDENVSSSVGSSTVALNSAIDVKSVYSSSDDSWVDVRLHGSFTGENASVSLPVPECNNLHAEHELLNLEDQSILGSRLRSKEAKAEGAGVDGDSHLDECCGDGVEFKEAIMLQQDMFEAELELVDHSPWAAITIRLLSLQNKSLVEVDQMVFLAVSGPVPEPGIPCRSATDQGANSLFAMFVPSMLQMARGVSGNSSSILKCESSSLACEQAQDIIDRLPAEKTSHSCEPPEEMLPAGAEHIGVTSIQNAGTENGSVQQDSQDQAAAHMHTHEASNAGSLLHSGGGDQEIPQFYGSSGAESKRAVEIDEQPIQSDSSAMPGCRRCEKLAGDFSANDVVSALGTFSERFDRLESLCLRMESYMQRTFENLDQRIMHLEAQHRKGSEEAAACVTASLKESRVSVEAHDGSQESGHSGVQYTDVQYAGPSDLPSGALCKEEVLASMTQSIEQEYSEVQVFNEVPNPIMSDVLNSDSAVVAEKLVTEEAPSENQEESRGPVAIRGSPTAQRKKPPAFLDEAWASALSAFASSFTPVVGAENTGNQVEDAQPSGSSHDVSISVSHGCEILGEETNLINKATTRCDAGLVAGLTNNAEDLNKEAVDGLTYEDCVQAPCDEPIPTAAHAFPIDVLQEKPDSFRLGVDFLGLRDTQSVPSKARTELNDFLEDIFLASAQGFSALNEDALATCPVFDIFATARLKSTTSSSKGLKSGLSPVLGSTSSKMHQDADFLSLGKEEAASSDNISGGGSEESRNFFHFEEKNKDFLYSFVNATSFEGSGVPSLFADASKSEEIFCNTRDAYTADLLGGFLSREKGKALDMSKLADFESFDNSVFTYCEAKGGGGAATSFPDVLEEDCSNYQDGRACSSSEDSLCFSQDFDTCPNELCDDEWSCAPNVFYLNDPELTDDETFRAAVDVEEKVEMSDLSDADSTEDAPFWPAGQHYGRTNQQPEPTTVFPGFENLS